MNTDMIRFDRTVGTSITVITAAPLQDKEVLSDLYGIAYIKTNWCGDSKVATAGTARSPGEMRRADHLLRAPPLHDCGAAALLTLGGGWRKFWKVEL
ncbi:hypothetical protein J6590_100338 [Homalodisca vitripennis]|nr:hypothetical protein J6590_100338 [Homalodisca vitripennis]